MIRRPGLPVALAAVALALLSACSQPGTAKHDASAALAAKGRLDREGAATQMRRKAEMEQIGARARSRAERDIARSDAREAQRTDND